MPRIKSWTDEQLKDSVAASTSLMGVVRKLGLRFGGGTYHTLRNRIQDLNLDTSHFGGNGWRENKESGFTKFSLNELLVLDGKYRGSTSALKKRLIRQGILKSECYECGITEWRGKPFPNVIDHINGNQRDNRIENLRILCAMCNAQTETFAGKNRNRYNNLGS